MQRWSRGHKARGQGQGQGHKKNPRPRPWPRTAFSRTDTLEAKDNNARGQGQGPRTQSASALQKKNNKGLHKNFSGDLKKKKKKKKVFTKIFQAISTKKRFPKNFSRPPQNFNIPKNSAVLEPRTGQFSRTWGLEAKAKDFKMCPRGLHLWLYVLSYPFIPTNPLLATMRFFLLFSFFFLLFSSEILYALLLLNHRTSKPIFCVKLLSCKRNFFF